MCDQIIRDAYDRYLTQKQDKRSRSVLSAQTRNLQVPTDLPGRTGLKTTKHHFITFYHTNKHHILVLKHLNMVHHTISQNTICSQVLMS